MATAENLASIPENERKSPELKVINGGKETDNKPSSEDRLASQMERIQKIGQEAAAKNAQEAENRRKGKESFKERLQKAVDSKRYNITALEYADVVEDLYSQFSGQELQQKLDDLKNMANVTETPEDTTIDTSEFQDAASEVREQDEREYNIQVEDLREQVKQDKLAKELKKREEEEQANKKDLEKALLDKEENPSFETLQEMVKRGEITEEGLELLYTSALAKREAEKIKTGEVDLREADKTIDQFDEGTRVLQEAVQSRESQLKAQAIEHLYSKVQEASETGKIEFGAKDLHESRQKLTSARNEFQSKYGVAPEKMSLWKKAKMRLKNAEEYYGMVGMLEEIKDQTNDYNGKVETINDTLGSSVRSEAHKELEDTGRIEKPDYDSLPIGESGEMYHEGVTSRLESISSGTQEVNKVYREIFDGNTPREEGLQKIQEIQESVSEAGQDLTALVAQREKEVRSLIDSSTIADQANEAGLIDFDGDELWDVHKEVKSQGIKMYEQSGGIDPEKPGVLGTLKNWFKVDKGTRKAYKEAKKKYGKLEKSLLDIIDNPKMRDEAEKLFAQQKTSKKETNLNQENTKIAEKMRTEQKKNAEMQEKEDQLLLNIKAEMIKLDKNISQEEAIATLGDILGWCNDLSSEDQNALAPIDKFKMNIEDKGDVEFYISGNTGGRYDIRPVEGASLYGATELLKQAREGMASQPQTPEPPQPSPTSERAATEEPKQPDNRANV